MTTTLMLGDVFKPEQWYMGCCDYCATEDTLVRVDTSSRERDRPHICQVCCGLLNLRDERTVNLAQCTNLILKRLDMMEQRLVGKLHV